MPLPNKTRLRATGGDALAIFVVVATEVTGDGLVDMSTGMAVLEIWGSALVERRTVVTKG